MCVDEAGGTSAGTPPLHGDSYSLYSFLLVFFFFLLLITISTLGANSP